MKANRSIWLSSIIFLIFAGSASADLVTVNIGGIVDSVGTSGGFSLDGSVNVDSIMSGSFVYDTDAPDLDADPRNGHYSIISVSMTIGNYMFTRNPLSPNPAFFKVYTVVNAGYLILAVNILVLMA